MPSEPNLLASLLATSQLHKFDSIWLCAHIGLNYVVNPVSPSKSAQKESTEPK